MLALDKDAFLCDMAETYHLFDIKSVNLPYLAVLASGLGVDSRIKLKAYGLKASWSNFLEKQDKGVKSNSKVFASVEDFEAAKAAILGGHTDG